MATRLELFRQQATEFNNLSDAQVTAWFDTAVVYLTAYIAGIQPTAKQDLAVALYAAHLAWLLKYPGQGGASRGPIKSEEDKKMGAKKEYNMIQNSDTWLGQSLYGQAFSNLTGIGGPRRAAILTRFGVLNNEFL